jgi:hypothetical protein
MPLADGEPRQGCFKILRLWDRQVPPACLPRRSAWTKPDPHAGEAGPETGRPYWTRVDTERIHAA